MPNPGLRQLDKLVGTWEVRGRESGPEGEISGQVIFEWAEGGHFLKQHVHINHIGHIIHGIEIIGYERRWGAAEPESDCTSHFFDNFGNHFEYVWETGKNTLTIWGGYIGSEARFKGKFNESNDVLTGAWKWPGGGYQTILTKIK